MKKAGDVSDLIKGPEEIRILKATEVVPEKKKSYEEVKPWLERVVQSRKQREAWLKYMDELKKKEGVVIYDSALAGPQKPEVSAAPMPLVPRATPPAKAE